MAVIQSVKGSGQLECEAVVGSEAASRERGPPADRGVGKGTEHRSEPDDDQHSPGIRWP